MEIYPFLASFSVFRLLRVDPNLVGSVVDDVGGMPRPERTWPVTVEDKL